MIVEMMAAWRPPAEEFAAAYLSHAGASGVELIAYAR